jgi:ATP-dependent RNA helicase DDX35
MATRQFLAPSDDSAFGFEADKVDVDTEKGTTFVYNPTQNLPLKQQRQALPAFKHRTEVLYLLDQYQTVVLCGETGSGKSTQIPQVSVLRKMD